MKKVIDDIKNIDVIEQIQSAKEIFYTFLESYKHNNSWKIRLIDSFIVFCGIIFILQFVYIALNGLFPMNSLIAGLVTCIGSITLAGNNIY
jgi:oligosaccharyltransferase complex subunit epsilon